LISFAGFNAKNMFLSCTVAFKTMIFWYPYHINCHFTCCRRKKTYLCHGCSCLLSRHYS